MKRIEYDITFYSAWHCGSGLSAGADLDTLVIKDKDGLPFIPGKTMKGLIREAVEDYSGFRKDCDDAAIERLFGKGADKDHVMGTAFFTNAQLSDEERNAIVSEHLQPLLYNKVTTTAIGEDGIAKDHSLRSMEAVVPCCLHGEIYDVDEQLASTVVESLGLIKRMGVKRNRGLGRCDIKAKIKEK